MYAVCKLYQLSSVLNCLVLKTVLNAQSYTYLHDIHKIKSFLSLVLPGVAHCIMAKALPPGAEQRSKTFSPSLTCKASTGSREAAFRR